MTATAFRPVLLSLAVIALSVSGCAKPFIKRAANTPDPKPSPVMVAGMNVRFDSDGNKGLVGAIVDASQNAQLEEFGKKATELSAAVLAQHGFTVAYDKTRSEKLDVIQIASNSTSAALTGSWRHPETSHMGPDNVENFLTKPVDIVSKITVAGQKEYFSFTALTIRDGGMFMKEPQVIVRTSVFDQDGKKVLDLQGIGYGESAFMFADRSPKNLTAALERGFESVKAVQEEAL